jgi:hypothetical protein
MTTTNWKPLLIYGFMVMESPFNCYAVLIGNHDNKAWVEASCPFQLGKGFDGMPGWGFFFQFCDVGKWRSSIR